MLLAQPHYAWIGSNRFWEKHLRIPGELDVYGIHLIGHPGVIIGFNEHVAWTHTVPAGSSFTLYAVDLVSGQPTRYRFGDEERDMTSREVAIEVRGEPEPVRHTVWSTHHGPLIASGGPLQWTPERAYALRDANAENGALLRHVLATGRAGSMEAFQAAHGEHQGLPWLNTIAASAGGVAWFADGSVRPHVGPAALAEWRQRRETDPVTAQLWEGRAGLPDGSDPAADWVDDPDARHPGVVPFCEAPQLERNDYVFNANDSYWLVHADTLLAAGISPLYGRTRSALSVRSRNNVLHVTNATPDRPAGEDGRFNLRELQEAALGNRSLTGDLTNGSAVSNRRSSSGRAASSPWTSTRTIRCAPPTRSRRGRWPSRTWRGPRRSQRHATSPSASSSSRPPSYPGVYPFTAVKTTGRGPSTWSCSAPGRPPSSPSSWPHPSRAAAS
jgi:acyl-homoserine-lactone acylase